MNTVYFDTPGLLDMRAVTTFGLSVKENENPIGYFGTGLKYAIAILMRNGADLTISTSSGDVYQFKITSALFRDVQFDAIYMNEKEMPFTTELGRNWKVWMAFRELYCNTQDENGVCHIGDFNSADSRNVDWADWTRITVRDKDFYEAYVNRHNYFLEDLIPTHTGKGIEIFTKRASAHMFYKRIRVGDLQRPAIMTYNHVQFIELTEDRTVANNYMWDQQITQAIAACNDEDIIRAFVLAPVDVYEATAVFSEYISDVSEEFMKVMKPLAYDLSGRVNAFAQDLFIKHADKTGEAFVFVDLSTIQQTMFTKAVEVCVKFGHRPANAEIHFVQSLGPGVMGVVRRDKIFLSIETFDMGTKMLAGTLMEELIHLECGLIDMTRGMQNFLINRIMTMYEESKGEPL